MVGYLVLILLVIAIFTIIIELLKPSKGGKTEYNIMNIGMKQIDNMNGSEFEHYIHLLFHAIGYKECYLSPPSRDFGADVIFKDFKGQLTRCTS